MDIPCQISASKASMYHHHFCLCEGNGATLFADHDEEYLVDKLNWIVMIGPILVTLKCTLVKI